MARPITSRISRVTGYRSSLLYACEIDQESKAESTVLDFTEIGVLARGLESKSHTCCTHTRIMQITHTSVRVLSVASETIGRGHILSS